MSQSLTIIPIENLALAFIPVAVVIFILYIPVINQVALLSR